MLHDSDKHDSNEPDSRMDQPKGGGRGRVIWYAATALSLAANAYLLFLTHDMANGANAMRDAFNAQIAALDQKVGTVSQDSQQRIDSVSEEARQEAAAALKQASAENRKTSAQMASTLAQHQAEERQVASAVNDLKEATATAATKISAVSGDVDHVKGDVSSVKADVASTRTEVEGHGEQLKQVKGDLGVMSGLIATNGKQLAELRALGERNYIEFDIKRTGAAEKVADIQLVLRKADPKRNRFTLDVLADDKTTEKRDRTVNEPIQLYVAGGHQPYEIVVNTVNKNEVTGYLSTPKTQVASR